MAICKFADDVWLSLHAFRLNIEVATNNKFNKDMISISTSSKFRLLDFNSKGNGNDGQIKAVVKEYQIQFKNS
jgi:predicted fused transcriptional regulator/phosphomethylpyrimidine kinase